MYGLKRQQCAVCESRHGLQTCGGCKVTSYCSHAHQMAHRPAHKQFCNAIKKTRGALSREEAILLKDVNDYMNTVIGRFWYYAATHDYMKARFAAACALLRGDTRLAAEAALDHFQKMLCLDRRDQLRVRDMIAALMLRLGQEQECYDFLKWWANDNTAFDKGDDLSAVLDICKANVFEPVEKLRLDRLSLSQLASLTLLKMRLGLDFEDIESEIVDQQDICSKPQTREYTDSD